MTAGVVTQPEIDTSTRPWNINGQKFCYRIDTLLLWSTAFSPYCIGSNNSCS